MASLVLQDSIGHEGMAQRNRFETRARGYFIPQAFWGIANFWH